MSPVLCLIFVAHGHLLQVSSVKSLRVNNSCALVKFLLSSLLFNTGLTFCFCKVPVISSVDSFCKDIVMNATGLGATRPGSLSLQSMYMTVHLSGLPLPFLAGNVAVSKNHFIISQAALSASSLIHCRPWRFVSYLLLYLCVIFQTIFSLLFLRHV